MPRSAHTSMTIASRWARWARRAACDHDQPLYLVVFISATAAGCSRRRCCRNRLARSNIASAGSMLVDSLRLLSSSATTPFSSTIATRGAPRDMQADDLRDKYLLRISVRLSGSHVRYARLHRRKLMVSHLVGAEASSHEPTPLGRREAGCCRFAASSRRSGDRRRRLCWWACEDLNLGP